MNLRRLNMVLLVLAVVLGVALTVLVTQGAEATSDDTGAGKRGQDHIEVTRAATAQVQAFLGIDHKSVEEQTEMVLDGATGEFKKQYAEELDALVRSAKEQKSTAEATVLEVGIGDIGPTKATVQVAANTEVSSKSTDGKPRTVPWRIQLTMVKEGERWLTAGLEFVE